MFSPFHYFYILPVILLHILGCDEGVLKYIFLEKSKLFVCYYAILKFKKIYCPFHLFNVCFSFSSLHFSKNYQTCAPCSCHSFKFLLVDFVTVYNAHF